MTWRRAHSVARVAVIYLALMAVVWFGYQVWHATQPRSLDCFAVGPNELYCESLPQPALP
jgi:hypothetical protein